MRDVKKPHHKVDHIDSSVHLSKPANLDFHNPAPDEYLLNARDYFDPHWLFPDNPYYKNEFVLHLKV